MDNLNLLVTLYLDNYQNDNNNTNRDIFNNITWSPFDRIVFTNAQSLKELCGDNYSSLQSVKKDYDRNSRTDNSKPKRLLWNGVKQCMHLIEERFADENKYSSIWMLQSSNDQDKEQLNSKSIFTVTDVDENGDNIKIDYAFHCIYSMRFSNNIQNLRNDNQIYDKKLIRKEVFKKILNKVCGKKLDFRCFRSLGSEDMVIIFLSDSMKEIVTIVDYINRLKINLPAKVAGTRNDITEDLFSTICVFSGLNDPNYDKEIDLDLIIRLNLRRNNPNEVYSELKQNLDTKIYRRSILLGMRAMELYIRAGKITYKTFHNDGMLNGASQFYKDNIYSSRTYFCIPSSVTNIITNDDDLTINIIDLGSLSLLNPNRNWDKNETDDVERLERINPVADFVYGEYERLISSQRTIQWYEILSKQYMAVKSFVEYYSKHNYAFDECAILNYAQSSLHLINQACSPVSEVPNHNHFYAGSFHDLIKSYYGIINMLFDLAYNLPRASKTYQHPATFAICLNSISRIESKIFTRHDIKNRIVIFFLPYDSFWNYADNIKLLVHEVFHYVSPYDRNFRASCFVRIIYNLLVVQRIHEIVEGKTPIYSANDTLNEIDISYKISEWIGYIIKKYDDIEKDLLKELNKFFPGFFIYSNPEWSLLFLNNIHNNIYSEKTEQPNSKVITDNIILMIDNYVKQVLDKYHDDAMKNLSDVSSEDTYIIRKEFSHEMIKKKIKELDSSTGSDYRRTLDIYTYICKIIKSYDIATKEAFCDLWSIRISGLEIPQYLAFLLKTMAKAYNPNSVLDGIDAIHLRETKMDIRGTVIRMLILIHKYINDEQITNISEIQLTELLIKKSDKGNSSEEKYISQCITKLTRKYIEYITLAKYEIESVCNIAFNRVDETLNMINSYDKHKCCEFLKGVAATDLRNCIRMDQIDHLSNFIGAFTPKVSIDNRKMPAFTHYERIGEDKHYKMLVSNVGEYMKAVKEISDKVSNHGQKHILWYRGVCSDRFSLLPSIFRKGDPSLSIYTNQANIIKRAYFSTLYISDIWNLPIEQRMAYLQHYGMPTNLLDFSIDPLTALHFAITPDVVADQQKIKDGTFQPVVYILDPMLYSRALRRMTEWKPQLNIPSTISSVNFDINGNPNERREFFVEDMSYDYLYEHNMRHTESYSPNDRGDRFPIPIVIQQSNKRIIAQSGTFVAFSLHAQPQDINGEDKFEYLNLLKIQERYMNFLYETSNFDEQFIFPIFLRKNYISQIKKELMFFNISTSKFYPELNKVFEDTTENGLYDGI